MTNSRALAAGTILNNKYQIEQIVGEGGFGITYKATDTLMHETVAIKEYFPSTLATRDTTAGITTEITIITGADSVNYEKGLAKFENEAANLAKFQHVPGIVSVKSFFKENNTGYMVMEYIDGITLKSYLESSGGRISYEQTIAMMSPIMYALSAVHRAGIIHRDISPDNIMVTRDGQLKLIDFGAARFVGNEDEKSLTVLLKEGYAPPEQYRTDGKQGPWTDVYALCATMYRMITGEIPVESVSRVVSEDKLKPIHQYTNIPKNAEKAILKGMSTSVSSRYATIDELKSGLEKKSNTKILIIAAITASVVAMILGIGLALLTHKNPEPDEMIVENDNSNTQRENVSINEPEVSDDDNSLEKGENSESFEEEEADIVKHTPEELKALEERLISDAESVSGLRVEKYCFDDFNMDGNYEMFAYVQNFDTQAWLKEETGISFEEMKGEFYFCNTDGASFVTDISEHEIDNLVEQPEVLQCGNIKLAVFPFYHEGSGWLDDYCDVFTVDNYQPRKVGTYTNIYGLNGIATTRVLQYELFGSCNAAACYYITYSLFYNDGKLFRFQYHEITEDQLRQYKNSDMAIEEGLKNIREKRISDWYDSEDDTLLSEYSIVIPTEYYVCDDGTVHINYRLYYNKDSEQYFSGFNDYWEVSSDYVLEFESTYGMSAGVLAHVVFEANDDGLKFVRCERGRIEPFKDLENAIPYWE